MNYSKSRTKIGVSKDTIRNRRGPDNDFSRHIEVYLYNAKLNQTSRKPKISPQIAVIAGFQVTSAACENFVGSTSDLKTSYHSYLG